LSDDDVFSPKFLIAKPNTLDFFILFLNWLAYLSGTLFPFITPKLLFLFATNMVF